MEKTKMPRPRKCSSTSSPSTPNEVSNSCYSRRAGFTFISSAAVPFTSAFVRPSVRKKTTATTSLRNHNHTYYRGASYRRKCNPIASTSSSEEPLENNDEAPTESPPSTEQPKSPIQKSSNIIHAPTLFQRPEAVLGVVIAAAALLTDFARNLFQLSMRSLSSSSTQMTSFNSIPRLANELRQVDESIESLQKALDQSKKSLEISERTLDVTLARANTADNAIKSVEDLKSIISKTREETSVISSKLISTRSSLNKQLLKKDETSSEILLLNQQRKDLQDEIHQREQYLLQLRNSSGATTDSETEQQLMKQIEDQNLQLNEIKNQRMEIEKKAEQAELKVTQLEQEAINTNKILNDTQNELTMLSTQAKNKQLELVQIEQNSQKLKDELNDANRLKGIVTSMEKELFTLQDELRARDNTVQNVEKESDSLRALLAAKEAELSQLALQLDSLKQKDNLMTMKSNVTTATTTTTKTKTKTNTSKKINKKSNNQPPDIVLQEINEQLKAGQLELSADIEEAKLEGLELSELTSQMKGEGINDDGIDDSDDYDINTINDINANDSTGGIDPLDKVDIELGVEQKRLQADMIKVGSQLRRKEYEKERKDGAVNEILESVEDENENLSRDAALQWPPVYPEDEDELSKDLKEMMENDEKLMSNLQSIEIENEEIKKGLEKVLGNKDILNLIGEGIASGPENSGDGSPIFSDMTEEEKRMQEIEAEEFAKAIDINNIEMTNNVIEKTIDPPSEDKVQVSEESTLSLSTGATPKGKKSDETSRRTRGKKKTEVEKVESKEVVESDVEIVNKMAQQQQPEKPKKKRGRPRKQKPNDKS